MRKICFLLVIVVLISNYSLANESGNTILKYDLEENIAKVLIQINLNEIEPFQLKIPKDSEEISSSETFNQKTFKDYKTVYFDNPKNQQISIEYQTQSVIENSKDSFFILDISSFKSQNISLELALPKQAILKYSLESPTPSIFPSTDKIKTDGQRITLIWDSKSLKDKEAILVIYNYKQTYQNTLITIVSISLVSLAIILIYINKFAKNSQLIQNKSTSSKSTFSNALDESLIKTDETQLQENLTKNLFEEEKQIVLLLLKSPENQIWQKELQHNVGISKVRLSRKLRNLKQKGLIESIPYGNTNKIRLIIN
ncbi:MAG TPA: hypothetical protein PLX15_05475 [Candidatus Woesearchaeota archaeon]|nr:hypothetical protein [Candidatus Woesearchaeota archaeon]